MPVGSARPAFTVRRSPGATRPFIEALLDAAQVARGTRMLDIACGPGFLASAGRARGAVARGLDFSPAMLAVARARDTEVRFDEGDAEALPYADASFDSVVANFGIHHVPRPGFALREAHRVLREGGRVAFSFWAEPAENVAWKLVFDAVTTAWRSRRGAGARTRRRFRHRRAVRRRAARGRFRRLHDAAGARDAGATAMRRRWWPPCRREPRAWRRCSRRSGRMRWQPSSPTSRQMPSAIAMRRHRGADRRGDRMRRQKAEGSCAAPSLPVPAQAGTQEQAAVLVTLVSPLRGEDEVGLRRSGQRAASRICDIVHGHLSLISGYGWRRPGLTGRRSTACA